MTKHKKFVSTVDHACLLNFRRSIFIYLCGAAIPLGIFPHVSLLEGFNVPLFLPIIKAMKQGDAVALSLAIDSHEPMEWFRKYELHTVLKEKCIVIVWRNLVLKT